MSNYGWNYNIYKVLMSARTATASSPANDYYLRHASVLRVPFNNTDQNWTKLSVIWSATLDVKAARRVWKSRVNEVKLHADTRDYLLTLYCTVTLRALF